MKNNQYTRIYSPVDIPVIGTVSDVMPDVSFCPLCGYVLANDGRCENKACNVVDAEPSNVQSIQRGQGGRR
jgi:hypothetical protein